MRLNEKKEYPTDVRVITAKCGMFSFMFVYLLSVFWRGIGLYGNYKQELVLCFDMHFILYS